MITYLGIGLGCGDEGKGRVVSALASRFPGKTIVVRFNGGPQAGHTAVVDGHRHVFSSFGSGTLTGAPTVWSRFCTVNPTAFLNELDLLRQYDPRIYIDPMCPVTTPYDVRANRMSATNMKHGTVGVGFGTTLERHEKHYKLCFGDLYNETVTKLKLRNIQEYYNDDMPFDDFLEDVKAMIGYNGVRLFHGVASLTNGMERIIFEGAQGILLDQNYGFFPHVTRSNTTGQNALELITEWRLQKPLIYYITRCYQTRHGNGPMTYEGMNPGIKYPEETNKDNTYTGKFRKGALDLDLIAYALKCGHVPFAHSTVVITCLDHLSDPRRDNIRIGNSALTITKEELTERIDRSPFHIDEFLFSNADSGDLK